MLRYAFYIALLAMALCAMAVWGIVPHSYVGAG
jgi:hypothetical protein